MEIIYNGYKVEVILLAVSGSRLYGNETEESDWDYRGVYIADKTTKLGLIGKSEQIDDPNFFKELNSKYNLGLKDFSDCVIYELNRFALLCSDANPNIFDILCSPLNKCVYINDKGKELLDNKNLFLSSKLKFTFSGYAISQLNKIRNRDKYLTRYPRISEVLDAIKEYYDNKLIDFNWICDNFGGNVADFVTNESPQNNIKLESRITWVVFKDTYNKGLTILGKEEIDFDTYRIPRLIDYCTVKNIK